MWMQYTPHMQHRNTTQYREKHFLGVLFHWEKRGYKLQNRGSFSSMEIFTTHRISTCSLFYWPTLPQGFRCLFWHCMFLPKSIRTRAEKLMTLGLMGWRQGWVRFSVVCWWLPLAIFCCDLCVHREGSFQARVHTAAPGGMFLNSSLAHVINTRASTCTIYTC